MDPAHLQGPCRPLHSRRSYVNRRARAIGRALAERAPEIGPRYAVRTSDGTVERAGVEVMHLPVQNAFTTDITSIYQPHDLQHLHLPELFSSWERERRERMYRTYCERAEMVIAMTSWGKGDLIDHYDLPDEKVQVVPWGSVLWEYPEPTPSDLDGLRRRPPSGLVPPLSRSNLAPQEPRGHARALALIKDREGLSVTLVCPGGNGQFARIQALIRELGLEGTARFPGFVSPLELRGLYELATALVFPSRFEGWGLPVCEAFSAELPVASSSASGLPDLVGDAGLVFDPDDPEQIARSMLRLWRDPVLRQTLAERGRERGAQFSFDHTARLFRAHYRRLGRRSLSEEDRILLASPPLA